MKKILFGIAAVSAFAAAPAIAQTVFTDNFDADGTPGTSSLNFAAFNNFLAPASQGTVDLVQSGQYGITCAGGSGKCVDLDGSTRDGGTLISNTLFSYNAGDLVNLTFQISGNQRNTTPDLWFGGFFNLPIPFYGNAGPIVGSSYFGNAGCGNFSGGAFSTNSALLSSGGLCPTNGTDPFSMRQIAFVAATAGQFRLVFGDYGALPTDNQGAILDNVRLSIGGAVPEPSTWMMLIFGFGLVGSAMRRRHATVALS